MNNPQTQATLGTRNLRQAKQNQKDEKHGTPQNSCKIKQLNNSLKIFYLPISLTKCIRHKLNKLMKSSPYYNLLH
jgi:hypothetical protein